ncbi:hypothetical protein ACFE04_026358 [Oxalis oulophora]
MKKSALPLQRIGGSGSVKKSIVCEKEGLVKLLRWHFGYSNFRGTQLDAIQAVLSGRDCFCLMPTGGGKSMCYQIPALAKPGITLVVSPLIALMENQVMALKQKRIAAEFLSSTQTSNVKNKIHEDLDSGKPSIRLLYVTPELIATPGFMAKLTKIHSRGLLSLIAIDEAHCISAWGHDFRPSYRKLLSLRSRFPDVPILALTATAAPKVQDDVMESLCLQNPLVLKSSFNRSNIFYEVRYKDLLDDTYADLSEALKTSGDVCGIVYCLERQACDDLSAHLSKNGISCAAYHAGLNNKLRSSVLDDWLSSKIQVVVATVAFGELACMLKLIHGMGIDRKDVRIVCHYNIPKSMEAFYQESGRAGRDQLPSRSLLYYGMDDRRRMEFILKNSESKKSQSSSSQSSSPQDNMSNKLLSDFQEMVAYCEGYGCRRKKILESFGEQVHTSLCKKFCDACKHPSLVASYLEELATTCATRQKNGGSRIFISSTKNDENVSEFWNRDDEISSSDEDISGSDDDMKTVQSLGLSKSSRKSGLDAKLEFLQRAEEKYYRNKDSDKQVSKPDRHSISDTLREATKQRLSNALKQAQQRLDNLDIQLDMSAAFLENECFKKYGKSGKSFYCSQVASTMRWLSTTTSYELTSRLGLSTTSPSEGNIVNEELHPEPSPLQEKCYTNIEVPQVEVSTSPLQSPSPSTTSKCNTNIGVPQVEVSTSSLPSSSPSTTSKLPPIPSFSEFVNSKKSKDRQMNALQKQSPGKREDNREKKLRLQ